MNRRQLLATLAAGFGYFLGGCLQTKAATARPAHWWQVDYSVYEEEANCSSWTKHIALVQLETDDPDTFPYVEVSKRLSQLTPEGEVHLTHDATYIPPAHQRGNLVRYHMPWNRASLALDLRGGRLKVLKKGAHA